MAAVFTGPERVNVGTHGQVQAWEVEVTSHTDGSGTSDYFGPYNGFLTGISTNPDGTDVPTDNWDVYVEDSLGADLMVAGGENRSASTSQFAAPGNSFPSAVVGNIRIRVANMGSGKKAVIRFYIKAA